jgi:membrane associated rhomboid family serine protease
MKSIFEIDWLREPAILRSRKYDFRWLLINSAILLWSVHDLILDIFAGHLRSALENCMGLVFISYSVAICAMDYRAALHPSYALSARLAGRARFWSWLLYERAPWMSGYGAILVIVSCLQHLVDVGASGLFPPSVVSLGFSKPFVRDNGEVWRMATGLLLHTGWLHLVGNLVGWTILCRFLEPLSARWTTPLVALLTALAGGAFSFVDHPNAVAVGFSGAVSGLTGFVIVLWMRRRAALPVTGLIAFFLCVVSGAVSDWFHSDTIDYGAHAGGFAAGWFLGMLLIDASTQEIPIREKPWAVRLGKVCAVLLVADAAYVIGTLLRMISWSTLL